MPTLLKPKALAALLDVHPNTVRAWLREGRIRAIRTPGGQYRIDPDEARKAMDIQPAPASEEAEVAA